MATSVASFIDRRIDPGALPLAVGDVVALSAILTVGVVNHNGVDYLTAFPVAWLLTLVPFLVGWAVAGPLIGAYSAGAAESSKAAVPLAVRGWVLAAVIGLGLRWTPLFAGGVVLVFALVTLVTGAVALGVWRWLYFKVVG